MKIYLLPLLLLFFTEIGSSQSKILTTDSISKLTLEKQATVMAKSLLAKDYLTFAKYTYRPIIDMAGGTQKMITLLKQTMSQLEKEGFTIIHCTVGKPSDLIHSKGMLQCTIPEYLAMKIPGKSLTTTSTLIAISNDKGENWTFIETHGKDLKTLQSSLPELSDELVLPQQEKPVITQD